MLHSHVEVVTTLDTRDSVDAIIKHLPCLCSAVLCFWFSDDCSSVFSATRIPIVWM